MLYAFDALTGTDANSLTQAIYGEGIMAANTDGGWVGSMTGFEAGSGYWFVASSPFQFEYNAPASGALFRLAELPKPPQVLQFAQSMNKYFYLITEAVVDNVTVLAVATLPRVLNPVNPPSRYTLVPIPFLGRVLPVPTGVEDS